MTIEREEARDRFDRYPRPLDYIRIRIHRGDQAELLRELVEDERDRLLKELADLRAEKRAEDDKEVADCIADIRHLNGIHRDIMSGLIELVGPAPEREGAP